MTTISNQTSGKNLKAHGAMLLAMVLFGLMATFSKDVLTHGGITGPQLVAFRICGAALLFWVGSLFIPQQHVERRDMIKIVGASFFGFVMAQGGYIVGLSFTSPINATIELTTMPIFTLILSALLLHERITPRRALGIIMGFTGAILLITRTTAGDGRAADFRGDLLILVSQVGYAFYLTYFSGVIRKYDAFTFNKWTFTFASLLILPFTLPDIMQINWTGMSARTAGEIVYIVAAATFFTFLLVVWAQRRLMPTTVSVYNYVQPFVTVVASMVMGLAAPQWMHAVAAALIFTGVWLVTREGVNRRRANPRPLPESAAGKQDR
ncbi:MAG: DMT family transporter [Muribaculaceae bacterium]|nr:DMT family transporter [Muribaculaceae bacterium]